MGKSQIVTVGEFVMHHILDALLIRLIVQFGVAQLHEISRRVIL